MFVCSACGYLFEGVETAEQLPKECPNCTASPDKFIEVDRRLESWVKKAVAQHIMYPDAEGADLKDQNSSLSQHIRFALVGASGDKK